MSTRPIRRPRDTWDWLTLGDLDRAVFCAYLDACRRQAPPEGERFVEVCPNSGEAHPWASREDFRDCLVELFVQRVNVLGLERGVVRSPASVIRELPRGRDWPAHEAMAQGCAAVAVGAGAPPAVVASAGRATHGNPLLSCP